MGSAWSSTPTTTTPAEDHKTHTANGCTATALVIENGERAERETGGGVEAGRPTFMALQTRKRMEKSPFFFIQSLDLSINLGEPHRHFWAEPSQHAIRTIHNLKKCMTDGTHVKSLVRFKICHVFNQGLVSCHHSPQIYKYGTRGHLYN